MILTVPRARWVLNGSAERSAHARVTACKAREPDRLAAISRPRAWDRYPSPGGITPEQQPQHRGAPLSHVAGNKPLRIKRLPSMFLGLTL
jgi:hypothetical protein